MANSQKALILLAIPFVAALLCQILGVPVHISCAVVLFLFAVGVGWILYRSINSGSIYWSGSTYTRAEQPIRYWFVVLFSGSFVVFLVTMSILFLFRR